MAVLELVASVASKVSIVGWIMAGAYQLYLNSLYNDVSGFSPLFLGGYVIGDIFNVLGTFWGRQMTFQKIIAVCSLTTDSLLMVQYLSVRLRMRPGAGFGRLPAHRVITAALFGVSHCAPVLLGVDPVASITGVTVQHEDLDYMFLAGQLFSWLAQAFYVGAVIPQVYRNFQDKCTGGVSIFLFISDLVGSFGYIVTIITTANAFDDKGESVEFLFKELPYLLGASFCFVLDLILMVQYTVYPEFKVEVLEGYEQTEMRETSNLNRTKPVIYGSL